MVTGQTGQCHQTGVVASTRLWDCGGKQQLSWGEFHSRGNFKPVRLPPRRDVSGRFVRRRRCLHCPNSSVRESSRIKRARDCAVEVHYRTSCAGLNTHQLPVISGYDLTPSAGAERGAALPVPWTTPPATSARVFHKRFGRVSPHGRWDPRRRRSVHRHIRTQSCRYKTKHMILIRTHDSCKF